MINANVIVSTTIFVALFMNRVYLGIGGNMADRLANLSACCNWIAKEIGTIIAQSKIYETKAWGNTNQANFYNQVIAVETNLEADKLVHHCLQIETKMGRVRQDKWGARTIDIDILLFANKIIQQENLQIPHPYLHLRKFVLVPLAEIAPNLLHPELHQNMVELLEACADDLEVREIDK